MSRIVGRRPVEIKISDPQNGYIPVFNSTTRLWDVIDKNSLVSGSAVTSGSNTFVGNQTVSGSLTVTQGITGSLFGTASYASSSWNLGGNHFGIVGGPERIFGTLSDHDISFYASGSKVATLTRSGSFVIGDSVPGVVAQERLLIDSKNSTSYNLIKGKGTTDNYLQFNIINQSSGSSASSDVVATAANGDENTNFIDMGINSSTFTGSVGDSNDAYLYSTGNDLHIGNASNFPIQFFAGGADNNVNRKLQLNPNNLHNMTGSLDVSGSIVAKSFTGSLQGTASVAVSASFATTASYLLGQSPTASYALTASYVTLAQTASYVLNAVSASYAATSSYANNFTVAGTLTAQTIVAQTITSSVSYLTGSTQHGSLLTNTHQFTGSVSVTGSLAVNGSPVILTNQTGSMSVATASYVLQAQSASYWSGSITNAATASYVLNAVSASFASTASSVNRLNQAVVISGSLTVTGSTNIVGDSGATLFSSNADTLILTGSLLASGSIILTGSLNILGSATGSLLGTASFATLAQTANTASYVVTAQTASYVLQAVSASFATLTQTANTASYVVTAQTASYVQNAQTASYVLQAVSSSFASTASYWSGSIVNAATASYVVTAQTASYVVQAQSASYWSGSIVNATSASFALTASFVNPLRQTVQLTGSLLISSSAAALQIQGSGSNVFSVDGTSGRLFSVDDSLSGSLFSVNTAAGLPVMEAFSDNTVRIGQFGQKALFISSSRVGIGKETPLNAILDISGSAIVTGSITSTVGFTGSLFGTSTTASYVLNAISSSYAATSSYATNFTVGNSLVVSGSSSFTGSLSVSGSILQNGGALAVQDGTILYHITPWFTPSSTVSTSGTTVTSVGTQFTSAMVGARLTISGESRLISTYTSTTQVSVDSAYSQNYSGVASGSWGVYSKAQQILSNGNIAFYGQTGVAITFNALTGSTATLQLMTNMSIQMNGGNAGLTNDNFGYFSNESVFANTYPFRWSSTTNKYGTSDLGIRRGSAGTLEIFDGVTNGTYRDLVLRNITGSNATFSGSLLVNGTSSFTGSVNISGSLTSTGTITAQTLVVQTISSSIEYASGSNIFGSLPSNTHSFTGSVGITGSLNVNNSLLVTGSVTAAGAIARSTYINPTLVASANSDVLVGLDINPTFSTGSFTGVSNIAIRTSGDIIPTTVQSQYLGNSSRIWNVYAKSINSSGIDMHIGSPYLYLDTTNTIVYNFNGIIKANWFNTGNLVLQNGGTFTDAGFKLDVSGSTRLNGAVTVVSASIQNQNTSSLSSGTQTISTNATASYTAAFYNYTIASGSNTRAGQFIATWNGGSIQYMDNSTVDIGSTLPVALTASLSGANVLLTSTLPSTGWTIKTLVDLI